MAISAPEYPTAAPSPQEPEKVVKRKSKNGLFLSIGAAAAGAGILISSIAGAGDKDTSQNNNNLPSTSEPSISASEVPGQPPVNTPEQPVTPLPTETVANPVTAGPEHVANYDQLVESAPMTIGEYPTSSEYMIGIADRLTKIMNYQPSPEELAASENLVSETSDATGRLAAAEIYRSAWDEMFIGKGSFYTTVHATGEGVFEKWYGTVTRNEAVPYEVTWTVNEQNQLVYSDNSLENSLPDSQGVSVYNLPERATLSGVPDSGIEDDRVWQLAGDSQFIAVK